MQTGRAAQRKAFPSGGRWAGEAGSDEGAIDWPNGAGEGRHRGDRSLLLQGKVGYRIAPSSVTSGDSFPPRGSRRKRYTPATKSLPAQPLLPQNANPNQGTYMGTVIAPRSKQCGTTAKTSEWERAGHDPGGPGGLPPALFLPISREKWGPRRAGGPPGALRPEAPEKPRPPEGYAVPPRAPARDRAGTHLAGSNLQRSRRDHLPTAEAPGPLSPHFSGANCQVKCNTSAGEANRRHFLGL